MLETPLRKLAQPWLDHAAQKAGQHGVSANAVTGLGMALGIAAAFSITLGLYGLGIVFFTLNRIADALDGAVARRSGPTAFGGVLDATSDFIFYAGVPFGFALAMPDHAVAVAFLLFSQAAYASAESAYAMFSKNFRSGREEAGTGMLHAIAGIAGSPESYVFFVLMCLYPDNVGLFCYIYGVLCFIAAGARVAAALGENSAP